MSTENRPSFARMCRAFPLRTALFTAGPLLIGIAQLVNASVHGSGTLVVAGVAATLGIFSVLVTRYHLSVFRRRRLDRPSSE